MTHDFADLIAELDAAKADLARSVKRARALIADRRPPPATVAKPVSTASVFNWRRPEERTDRPPAQPTG